ncbi:flavin reductase family protein [Cupriavidus basilensis]
MAETHAQRDADADEQRRFRSTLAMFATGVAVITAPRAQGAPVGITVASFNSSLARSPADPVLGGSALLETWTIFARRHAMPSTCLRRGQQDLSNRFARANSGKWDGIGIAPEGSGQAVLLPDALATFECEPYARHDGGDHVIFIGRVVRHRARPDGRPLVFRRQVSRSRRDARRRLIQRQIRI